MSVIEKHFTSQTGTWHIYLLSDYGAHGVSRWIVRAEDHKYSIPRVVDKHFDTWNEAIRTFDQLEAKVRRYDSGLEA